MPQVTLPDGSERSYEEPTTPFAVASDIGPGLAKAALGAKINGELVDLSHPIEHDCELAIVTAKTRDGEVDSDGLYLIRHSTAHVMAEAIQRLFPGTLLVYGPPLETGFYYDMALPEGVVISSEDFPRIEEEMAAIIKANHTFNRYEMATAEGLEKLRSEGSKYKLDNAQRAIEAGSEELSWYATGSPGEDWEDLCRGPHAPSTGRIGAFKIMSLASSYWHGDENSDRLTRVYGTAFHDKKQLKAYLAQLEEARKRDHRILGKQLRLFHIDEQVGQGLILWTPRGSVIRQELMNFIGEELRKQGYQQVFTPHIGKLDLYRTSGHFPYYQESQYTPIVDRAQIHELAEEGCSCADLANRMDEGEIDGYLLRPMNCPHHIRLYASEPHSYRDMPVRLAEFGTVYRWEQSGEIGGMTRVRGFTQDDAHLFCREDQVAQELKGCLSIVSLIFDALNMKDYRVRIGLRDTDSNKYVGEPENWDKAEEACREAARALGAPFTEEPGEAAFYGPKIDFVVRDVIGREWQLGTVQVDYNLPIRFDLSYVGQDNTKHRPVMIHRAPFGSFERFVGVLIEHFAGAFPCWLAPEQVRVLPISEKSSEYAQAVLEDLRARGIRATLDESPERIQAKVKVATEMKVPYLAVVGPRDCEEDAVSLRAFGVERNLGSIDRTTFLEALEMEVASRGGTRLLDRFNTDEPAE